MNYGANSAGILSIEAQHSNSVSYYSIGGIDILPGSEFKDETFLYIDDNGCGYSGARANE